MRLTLPVLAAFLLFSGCLDAPGPATPADGQTASPEGSNEWTVTSHLAPRGAMDVRFTVAEPTTCRLAFQSHQPTGGAANTETPAHADLWIDGEYTPVPFYSSSGYSNWNDRVKAGPVDTRTVQTAILDAYSTVAYGEGTTFVTGLGIPEIEIKGEARAVLSAMDRLVDGGPGVNDDIQGSLRISIECGAPVVLDVHEDADAVWGNPILFGGDVAAQAFFGGTEQGSIDFHGDGNATEIYLGMAGGMQGTLTFTGAYEDTITYQGLPRDPPTQTFTDAPAGDIHLEWNEVRETGGWWIGMSSWGPHAATIEPLGSYPF